MSASHPARILLCANGSPAGDEVRSWLQQAGHVVGRHSIGSDDSEVATAYDLVVVDSSGHEHESLDLCRCLRGRLGDVFVPILFLADALGPYSRRGCLEVGADACMQRPFDAGELLAQVAAFLRLKGSHDRLNETSVETRRLNKCLQQTYHQLNEELELARRIQQGMLPQILPEMAPVRFAVYYRPCGRVGGDFYDVLRLDEDHVGFYVADVMGHGVPASLLTIFLKKAVRTKEISGREYRLLPPEEVLRHVNREMLDQCLAEVPFITMVYGLFDRRLSQLTFARAGHPYPLYIPRNGDLEFWHLHGSLLGVFDTEFSSQVHNLYPGDKVLFYTDGIDTHVEQAALTDTDRLLSCASRHRTKPVADFIEQLARDLIAETPQPDDLTLLALEVASSEQWPT